MPNYTPPGGGASAATPSRGQLALTAQGLISEPFPRMVCNDHRQPADGGVYGSAIGLAVGDVITNIVASLSIAASGTSPTLIKMALADKTGKVLAATANLNSDAAWKATTGPVVKALSAPYTVPSSDLYYVMFLRVGNFSVGQLSLSGFSADAQPATYAALAGGRVNFGDLQSQADLVVNTTYAIAADATAITAFWLGCS